MLSRPSVLLISFYNDRSTWHYVDAIYKDAHCVLEHPSHFVVESPSSSGGPTRVRVMPYVTVLEAGLVADTAGGMSVFVFCF